MFFVDKSTGFITGDSSYYNSQTINVKKLLKTTNSGNSWFYPSNDNIGFLNIFFTDINNGFTATTNHYIYKTVDGGRSWNSNNYDLKSFIGPLYFINSKRGYVLGDMGAIFFTADGAKTWTKLNSGTDKNLDALCFTDISTGYIVGQDGIILKTTDAGLTWKEQYSQPYYSFRSVCFPDPNTGYVSGTEDGTLLKYTNDTINKIDKIGHNLTDDTCSYSYLTVSFIPEIIFNNLNAINKDTVRINLYYGDGIVSSFYIKVNSLNNFYQFIDEHKYQYGGLYSFKAELIISPKEKYTLIDYVRIPRQGKLCGNIKGKLYIDLNNNCQFDINEPKLSNKAVLLFKNNNLFKATLTDKEGDYFFKVEDTTGYKIKVDSILDNGFFIKCQKTFAITDKLPFNKNFGYTCNDKTTNLDIQAGTLRIGSSAYLCLNIGGLDCKKDLKIKLILDKSITEFFSETLPVKSGDTLIWDANDFYMFNNQIKICLNIKVSRDAKINDELCFKLKSGNSIIEKCFTVTGSYDPNNKQIYPYQLEKGINAGDTLNYTVHFQNTGNAEAYNVFVIDTLDMNLDLSTFRIKSWSHPMEVYFNANTLLNIVKFSFDSIMLPDSTTKKLESNGYVSYSICSKKDLAPKTYIHNRAHIYFDYNKPVTTNTATTFIKQINVNVPERNDNTDFIKSYPIPVNDYLNIDISNYNNQTIKTEIFNILGESVYIENHKLSETTIKINVSGLKDGVYILKLHNQDKSSISKIVVKH